MTRAELLQIAKPILFNTEMVKAILEGRKTVTRRCVKAKSKNACGFFVTTRKSDGAFMGVYDYDENEMMYESPQTQPAYVGDIMYVRETWCWCPCWDCGMDTEEHNCCYESANKFFNHDKGEWGCYGYKASFEDNEYPSVDTWHPSIHMPKEAARIFLRVKDVRVERLQDMISEDMEKEGLENFCRKCSSLFSECDTCMNDGGIAEEFKALWNSTIKKSDIDTYGWAANPWVWVIEFERIEADSEV